MDHFVRGKTMSGTRVALAAAVLLVLQSIAAAWGLEMAAAAPRDAFGNPLCHPADAGPSDNGTAPAGHRDCCTLACSAASGMLALPPEQGAVFAPFPVEPASRPKPFAFLLARTPEHNPGRPRAPPPAL